MKTPNTPLKKHPKTFYLKQGLAVKKKMEQHTRGPTRSSRTIDTALHSFGQTIGGIARFTPLITSIPKQKYKC